MSTTELVPHQEMDSPIVLLEHAPAAVLAEARTAATALADVLKNKPDPVMMNDEQYLEFEDWQTLGRFYGITAKEDGDPEFVTFGEVRGFKASAVAIDRHGREISRATAYCLSDEEKWGLRPKYEYQYVTVDGERTAEDPGRDRIVWEDNPKKPGKKRPKRERVKVGDEAVPLFQLSSMSQTRANSKVLRNVLSWVVVLAGYKATPAEELPVERTHRGHEDAGDDKPQSEGRQTEPAREQTSRSQAPTPAPAPAGNQPPPHSNGGALPKWNKPCPRCKVVGAVIVSKQKAGTYHCWAKAAKAQGCGYDFTPADAEVHQGAEQERQRGDSTRVRDYFDTRG